MKQNSDGDGNYDRDTDATTNRRAGTGLDKGTEEEEPEPVTATVTITITGEKIKESSQPKARRKPMDMALTLTEPSSKAIPEETLSGGVELWRIPQGGYVDAVRWMPPATSWHQSLAISLFDPDTGTSSLDLSSLSSDDPSSLHLQASWPLPSRSSSLSVSPFSSQQALIAAASFSGTVNFVITKLLRPSSNLHVSSSLPQLFSSPLLHQGAVSAMDLQIDTHDCVSVGEDGRINVIKLAESQLRVNTVVDNHGLTSFTAAKWASPSEFVTAGLGFSLQWWDHRRSGGVAQITNKW